MAEIQTDRFGDTHNGTDSGVPRRGFEGRKNRKKILRLENVAISGLPAEIFLAINVVVFVGAG